MPLEAHYLWCDVQHESNCKDKYCRNMSLHKPFRFYSHLTLSFVLLLLVITLLRPDVLPYRLRQQAGPCETVSFGELIHFVQQIL